MFLKRYISVNAETLRTISDQTVIQFSYTMHNIILQTKTAHLYSIEGTACGASKEQYKKQGLATCTTA